MNCHTNCHWRRAVNLAGGTCFCRICKIEKKLEKPLGNKKDCGYLDNFGISRPVLLRVVRNEGKLSVLTPEVILMPLSTEGRLTNR